MSDIEDNFRFLLLKMWAFRKGKREGGRKRGREEGRPSN